MSVQTYNAVCGMVVCVSGGQYVEASAYLAEKARADAAEKVIEQKDSEISALRYRLTCIKSLSQRPEVQQAARAALSASSTESRGGAR